MTAEVQNATEAQYVRPEIYYPTYVADRSSPLVYQELDAARKELKFSYSHGILDPCAEFGAFVPTAALPQKEPPHECCLKEEQADAARKQVEKSYRCNECDFKTGYKHHLKDHESAHRLESDFKCSECDSYTSTSKELMRRHMQRHFKKYPCNECKKVLSSENSLYKHKKKYHQEEAYKCNLCLYNTSWLYDLVSHVSAEHSEQKAASEFKCFICGYQTRSRRELLSHKQQLHADKKYMCNDCGYMTNNNSHLKKHVLIRHDKNCPVFACGQCIYVTKTKASLKRHESVHCDEYLFKCDECEKSFKSDTNLKRHKTIHLGLKPHRCTFCPYSAIRRATLVLHLRMHTGEKPYVCDHCSYATGNPSHLRNHKKRIHDNEKDFGCHECSYKAATRHELQRHGNKHKARTEEEAPVEWGAEKSVSLAAAF